MKKFLLSLAATITLILIGTHVSCAEFIPIDFWYLSASGSVEYHRDLKFASTSGLEKIDFEKPGGDAKLAAGALMEYWRMELEASFRKSNVKKVDTVNAGSTTHVISKPGGDVCNYSLMLNAYYDIPIYPCFFDIYIGGGLGVSLYTLELGSYSAGAVSYSAIDDKDILFAIQLMTGFNFNLTKQLTVFTGYRFFFTSEPKDFSRTPGIKSDTQDPPYSNSIEFGIRVKF